MKILKSREKGFTLIELLIVVAILGILAAVVVPQMGRFLGSGKTETRETELALIRTAVSGAMVDNGVAVLVPVSGSPAYCNSSSGPGTNDMTAFPDLTYTGGVTVTSPDTAGIVLWNHDLNKDDATVGTTKYISKSTTKYCYQVTSDAIITQFNTAGDPDTNN